MAIPITKPTVGGSAGQWGAELNTALDALAAGTGPPVGTADGAIATSQAGATVWQSGDYVLRSAASPGEIAYARNSSNVTQPIPNGTATGIIDISLEVPPCNLPVTLEWDMSLQWGGSGTGVMFGSVVENTVGSVNTANKPTRQPMATAGLYSKFDENRGSVRIGPSSGWRSFGLTVQIFSDSGVLLTSTLRNNYIAGYETTMRAVA